MKIQAQQTLIAACLMVGVTQVSLAENLFQARTPATNKLAIEPLQTALSKSAFKLDTPVLAVQNGLRMNPSAARQLQLSFQLPDGVTIAAKRVHGYQSKNGATVWIGKHNSNDTSLNSSLNAFGDNESVLVFRDGHLIGNIRHQGRLYQIRANANGEHSLAHIDSAKLEPDHNETSYLNTPVANLINGFANSGKAVNYATTEPSAKRSVREVAEYDQELMRNKKPDTPSIKGGKLSETSLATAAVEVPVIRVMVHYTAAAKAGAGTAVKAIDDLITLSFAETNRSYQNSNINARVELAHAAQVSYTESDNSDTDKQRYAGVNDGFMDEVHQQRDLYAADLGVLMLEKLGGVCGSASKIGADAATAFVVVKRSCSAGSLSFPHELGHLFGARHNIEKDATATIPYAHGYLNPSNKWRTIMAYDCPVSCPRLAYWSNPRINYTDGLVMGVASTADNARLIGEQAARLAAFRPPLNTDNVAPVVNAGNDRSLTLPNTLTLQGTASDDGKPSGSQLSYVWTKVSGPGEVTISNANVLNPSLGFNIAGNYVLRLTVSDGALQSSDDVNITVIANTAPIANFLNTVNQLAVQFTDVSTDADGSITQRLWNFGDGSSDTGVNPLHTYAVAGTYTVTLTVTDNVGATHTKSMAVMVAAVTPNVAPTANFSASNNALLASFTDASSDSDGSVTAWAWDFGDGATSTLKNPTHSYSAAGTYKVSLLVKDNQNASSAMFSKNITVTTPSTTDVVLQQSTAGGNKLEIKSGQTGAQSFKYGTSGSYVLNKLVLYVARDSLAPNSSLNLSIGTVVNASSIAGSSVSIAAANITNVSAGSSFQKIEVALPSSITLSAGKVYYLNLSTTASNGKAFYVEVSSSASAYANGTYYKNKSDEKKDLRFSLIGH